MCGSFVTIVRPPIRPFPSGGPGLMTLLTIPLTEPVNNNHVICKVLSYKYNIQYRRGHPSFNSWRIIYYFVYNLHKLFRFCVRLHAVG